MEGFHNIIVIRVLKEQWQPQFLHENIKNAWNSAWKQLFEGIYKQNKLWNNDSAI